MELGLKLANMLVSFASSYISIAAIIMFLHCFYDPGMYWTKKKGLILLPVTIVQVITEAILLDRSLILSLIPMITLLIQICIIVYDYPGRKFKTGLRFFFILILLSSTLTSIFEVAFIYLFPTDFFFIGDTYNLDLLMLVTNTLLTLPFACVLPYLYRRLYKPGIFIHCGKGIKVFVWIYFISTFILGAIAVMATPFDVPFTPFTYMMTQINQAIMVSGFILAMVLIPIMVYASRITEHFVFRTQYQDGYMQTELEHFKQYKQSQEETRRFRHDVKNDLQCLKEMLSSGKTEEARAYLENLAEVADALGEKYVTGDEILDSILTAKGATMEQHRIDFRLDGVLAGSLKWKPVDICCVFANAIDNAIEACQQVPEADRCITLKIKTAPQFWFVRIENPVKEDFDTSLLFHKQGGYTSKADSSRHGIGTYSIKYTAESYGGIVKATCENKLFSLEIMIPQ